MTVIQLKYKPYLFLLTTIILFVFCISYSSYLNSERDHINVQKNFEQKLQQQELLLNILLSEISDELDISLGTKIFLQTKFKQLSSEHNIIIQIFRNGNPIYWSDNKVRFNPSPEQKKDHAGIYSSGNGLYRLMSIKKGDLTFIGLILIKSKFVYQNEYLKNDFNSCFNLHEQVELSFNKGKYNIYSAKGKFLFSLVFPLNYTLSTKETLILFIPYFLLFILLLHLTGFIVYRPAPLIKYKGLNLLLYITIILSLRLAFGLILIPEKLFSSDLFSPILYAIGTYFSSLGSLLLTSVTFFFISNTIFRVLSVIRISIDKSTVMLNLLLAWFLFFIILVSYQGVMFLIGSLVINSQNPFDPGNIGRFDAFSWITLLSACLLVISFLLFSFGLLTLYLHSFKDGKSLQLYTTGVLTFILPVYYFMFTPSLLLLGFIVFLISISLYFRKYFHENIRYNKVFIIGIFIMSLLCTLLLNNINKEKEYEKRKAIAEKLTSGRDHFSEFLFEDLLAKMKNDRLIWRYFQRDTIIDENGETRLSNYIKQKYFHGYWNKYNFLFTFCEQKKMLQVKPNDYIISCYEYFDDIIAKNGISTKCKDLYYLNNTSINDNYLAVIISENHNAVEGKIFIEFYPKHLPTGLGYPEILSNKEYGINEDLSEYSWANYENRKLVHYYGSFFYETHLQKKYISNERFHSYTWDDYNHLVFYPDKDNVFIISRKTDILTAFTTRFSILFLSLILVTLFINFISGKPKTHLTLKSFRNRLQISYILLILISFLLIGSVSLLYLLNLNNQKNHKLLREKAHSVLVELEHKISGVDSSTLSSDYLKDILYKFSLVFFTDIHLYNLKGELIATSRPELFNQGLMAPLMNTEAYNKMSNLQLTEFLQKEEIGNYSYISTYLPFYNEDNELMAYINLPYFARQDELRYEISNLLVAFVNIYFLLFVIALMIVFAISKYINKPIEIIRKSIASISLGNYNEKIEWNRDDEIGSLVKEYNRMIDELSNSAELLAKSERESAWRQMAQQIAHEIKNPLTPMKLSVQFLNRAWKDNHPDFETRLQKFTETMIEQIDSLSFTASEFSNFAKYQQADSSVVDLRETINKAFDRFRDITIVKFKYNEPENSLPVLANAERLVRTFHNLISNSIQAIGEDKEGWIRIDLETQDRWHIIKFADNGSGIPIELHEKIFSPYFTTKTGGTGLGLAIVKNIVSTYGGTIEFISEVNQGTIFIIRLPVYRESGKEN